MRDSSNFIKNDKSFDKKNKETFSPTTPRYAMLMPAIYASHNLSKPCLINFFNTVLAPLIVLHIILLVVGFL